MSDQEGTFQVLPGLPPYGEPAVPFPTDTRGAFSEGVVIRFHGADGSSWVGNFRRGSTGVDFAAPHPDGRNIIVVAGGDGYVIEPCSRRLQAPSGFLVDCVVFASDTIVVLASFVEIYTLTSSGTRVSERISWDGFRGLAVLGMTLRGEAWSPISQNWHPFSLDLPTNEVTNGIYSADMAGAVRMF